jgi:hypothetical protein
MKVICECELSAYEEAAEHLEIVAGEETDDHAKDIYYKVARNLRRIVHLKEKYYDKKAK